MIDTQKYQNASLGKCMSHLYGYGICLSYEDYLKALMNVEDWDKIIQNILDDFHIDLTKQDTEDQDIVVLLYALLEKLALEVPICARDRSFIQQEIIKFTQPIHAIDPEAQNALFLRRYELLKRLKEDAMYRGITTLQEMNELYHCDIDVIFNYYVQEAYQILPRWQYHDVMHHEYFGYHFIAYFKELFMKYQESLQCDVADLYMLHGDEQKAHRAYQQLLKQSKQYGKVAYRYASIVKQCENQKVARLVTKLLDSKQLNDEEKKSLQTIISGK